MYVELKSIENQGNLADEKIVFEVTADADAGDFILFATEANPDGFNLPQKGHMHRAFRFPDKFVRTGDQISVFTKGGTPAQEPRPDGTTHHVFYWHLPESVWDQPGRVAVLMEIADWNWMAVK